MCNATLPQASSSQPLLYRRFVRIKAFGALGALLAIVGCTAGDSPLAPTDPLASRVALSPAIANVGGMRGWSAASREELKSLLVREQERTLAEQERSAAQLAAAKWEFEGNPDRRNPKAGPSFLWCAPLQYAAGSAVIGPEGGEIDLGRHKLTVPAGALTEHTVITAELPVSTNAAVKFSPHGLRFATPAVLTIDYRHCSVPVGSGETAVYFDESHNFLEWPTTTVRSGRATVQIWHFSQYGMASGRK